MTAAIISAYTARPALQPGQHPTEYGRIALRYMLAADVEVFGLFTDEELDAIHHAARHATTQKELEPTAARVIADLQDACRRTLERRSRERYTAILAAFGEAATQPHTPADLLPESAGEESAQPEPTDEERIANALRALIHLASRPPSQDDGRPDGGTKVPTHPRPPAPPTPAAKTPDFQF